MMLSVSLFLLYVLILPSNHGIEKCRVPNQPTTEPCILTYSVSQIKPGLLMSSLQAQKNCSELFPTIGFESSKMDEFQQQLMDMVMSSLNESLTSTITSLTERQNRFENICSERLNFIRSQLTEISKQHENLFHSVPDTPSYQDKNQPAAHSQTDPALPHQTETHNRQNQPLNSDPLIDSASRTLGFHPVYPQDIPEYFDNSQGVNILANRVREFMASVLLIPSSVIAHSQFYNAW